ncbi:hypothetical protein [uncultured Aquimarina sp.]|uniref:hypothetical protein n=1 Tax=uncultured Aquimarina sp. TaxID=575652 RepID=UPI00260815ED|nr:hypothetical protein [uncultured Aquimarina sp.]
MKSFKLIVILVFSLLCGNNFVSAQQHNSDGNEKSTATSTSVNNSKKVKTKKSKTSTIKTDETIKLHSKSERDARALTAQKTKKSGKGNIPPEKAKKEREARIAAIIEANKTKKKTPSKRNN